MSTGGRVYLAVAQWGWVGDLPTHHESEEFATHEEAKAWVVQYGRTDPDALIKVYEGTYDEWDNFEDTQDYYFDGEEWT